MLTVKITLVSPTHHTMEYRREDGTGEIKELETKSFLKHDLYHFCLESTAGLQNGFFGLLAQGRSYDELSGKMLMPEDNTYSHDTAVIERVAGPIGMVLEEGSTPAEFLSAMQNIFSAYQEPIPLWLNEAFIMKAKEKYRQINGEWNSLKFGQTLELHF